jgi:hypothetical protein
MGRHAFISTIHPRVTTQLTPEALRDKLLAVGLQCQVFHFEGNCGIEFERNHDVLHLIIKHGLIEYIEHAPAYGRKPVIAGYISDLLDEAGFEWLDDDDLRNRSTHE